MFFTIEFISSSQGSANADKFLKVANDGSVYCDDFDVNPQDIEDAVTDYLTEHPVTVITDDELLPASNNPVKNSTLYSELRENFELTPIDTTDNKKAISSADGTVITTAGNPYEVKTFEIDPTKTYLVSAYGYDTTYAYYAFYKIVDDTETPISWVAVRGASQRYIEDELIENIPSDATLLKVAGHGNVHVSKLKTPSSRIEQLEDRATTLESTTSNLNTRTVTLENKTAVLDDVDLASDDTIIQEMFEVTNPLTLTKEDFTIQGYYSPTDTSMVTRYAYHSTPLYQVVEGQTIYWHEWMLNAYAMACCLYDNDGLPYNGTSARKDYNALTTKDQEHGEFSLVIPSGCSQIGFSLPDADINGSTLQGNIVVSELSYDFSNTAKESIQNIVQTTPVTVNSSNLDFGVYYQRGAYGQSFDYSKKPCILAGGQSNAAGRAPYIRFPFDLCGESGTPTSPFTLPNVQYLGATEDFGTSGSAFADATIRQKNETESSDNSWSFDSVTYACLTNASYGNQADIHVVKRAVGGTSIDVEGATNLHWTADYKNLTGNNSLLKSLEGYVRTAEQLQASGYEIRAMVWHQGEGDSQNQGAASRYYTNFKKMITYIRGIVGNPFLPFYCGTISDNNHADAYKNVVNAAMNQIAAEDQYVRVVDMSGAVLEDSWHFDYKACIYFGKAIYNMMLEDGVIQNGTPIDNPLPDNWTSNS